MPLLVLTTGRSRSNSSLKLPKLFPSSFSAFCKGSHIRQIKERDPALLRVGLDKLGAESSSSSSPCTYAGSLLCGAEGAVNRRSRRTCGRTMQVLFVSWFHGFFLCCMSDCVASPVLIKQTIQCVSGSFVCSCWVASLCYKHLSRYPQCFIMNDAEGEHFSQVFLMFFCRLSWMKGFVP